MLARGVANPGGACGPSLAAPLGPCPAADPRHDPDFVDRCLVDLFTHWGEWRRLGRLYAAHVPDYERCTAVRHAVDWGRRIGFVIEGNRSLGYRVVAFRHPAAVYRVKPGGGRPVAGAARA